MVISYTIFDEQTGAIHDWGEMPEDDLAANMVEGEAYIEGAFPADQYRIVGESAVELPVKPEPWLEFDFATGEWVEPRSQAEYDNALHYSRMQTEIPTGLAIHKLAEIGAYSMAEVANDEAGIPATIREFIDLPEFPQLEKDLMLAYFKTMPMLPRSMTRVFGPIHPNDPGDGYPAFIPWLATAKSITITPEQLDILWNVPVPPPLYEAE